MYLRSKSEIPFHVILGFLKKNLEGPAQYLMVFLRTSEFPMWILQKYLFSKPIDH